MINYMYMGDDIPPASESLFVVYRVPIILLALSSLLLILASGLIVTTFTKTEPIRFSSDIKEGKNSSESATITIDISGAVMHAGVYQLPVGSRIVDALVEAGGVSTSVDRVALERSINQASILSDGAKVYIPLLGATPSQTQQTAQELVNINTATSAQLDVLSGVGVVTAKKIIENRPYTTLEELVSKHVLSPSIFDKLKNQLSL